MLTAIILYLISPTLCLGWLLGGGLSHHRHHNHRCDDD